MPYAVVIEKGARNYSAYVPDLPGCVSVGDTLQEVTVEICEAIAFRLQDLREDGSQIPSTSISAEYLEIESIIVKNEQLWLGPGDIGKVTSSTNSH